VIVASPRELLWSFLSTRVEIPWSEDFRAIGKVKSDCLLAVVGYNGFTGRTCFMHSAIDDPSVIDRTFVRAVFEYPFVTCNLTHVLAPADSANEKSLTLLRKVGFKEAIRFEDAGLDGKDLILLQLKRDECRWIKDRHGKQVATASA
jgi:RimJ/RimL family protein N-acetyltransferase